MSPLTLEIDANRQARKYSRGEMFRRVLWGVVRPLFRFSPRPFFAWRRALLRLFGAKIGRQVHIYGSAVIRMPWNLEIGDWSAIGEEALIYNLGKVNIGERVTISHRAHLCAGTHDYRDPAMPLLKPPITINSDAWICSEAYVGPGVMIGQGAVVGARAVVVKNVEPWNIMAGNPARTIGTREFKGQGGES